MEWQVISVETNRRGGVPFVRISNKGTFNISAGACELVEDDGDKYKFVQFLKGVDNGKTVFAIRFLAEEAENCLKVRHASQKGKSMKGIAVSSAQIYKDYFKNEDNSNVSYKLEKIDDNTLAFVMD